MLLSKLAEDAEISSISRPFFSPLSDLPFYNSPGSFPVSSMLAERCISLPSGASLKNEEIELVCGELKKILK